MTDTTGFLQNPTALSDDLHYSLNCTDFPDHSSRPPHPPPLRTPLRLSRQPSCGCQCSRACSRARVCAGMRVS